MANIYTKGSGYPMTNHLRDFCRKMPWHGQLPPSPQGPVRPLIIVQLERPNTIPEPKYTLDTIFRASYQWPRFTNNMPDDIMKDRYSYTPYKTPVTGAVPCLNPTPYKPVVYKSVLGSSENNELPNY